MFLDRGVTIQDFAGLHVATSDHLVVQAPSAASGAADAQADMTAVYNPSDESEHPTIPKCFISREDDGTISCSCNNGE